MKRLSTVLLLVLLVTCLRAQPPILPDPPPSPPPPPAPQQLVAGMLYCFESDAELTVLTSPAGLVTVTKDAGPIKIRGVFVGGNGGTETRTFKLKNVWSLEAAGTGSVELLIVSPDGTITRRTLVVGMSPVPPTPPEPTDPAWPALKAAWAKETPADKAILGKLASLYTVGATTANDPTLTTVGALFTKISAARKTLLGEALPSLRAAVGAELDKTLPTNGAAPLDAPTRALVAQQFTRMGTLLTQLGVMK